MISLENIRKKFPEDIFTKTDEILKGVSFKIPKGEITGFIGANGAGKTTLLKILMGLLKEDSGHIHFSPVLGNTRHDIFNRIGHFPERPYFYPELRGMDILYYLGELNGLSRKTIREESEKFGKRLNINFAFQLKIKSYSKGMLQRLGIVSALIHNPLLVILDEPLAGLDPLGRKELKDVLKEIHKLGKTIFFTGHVLSDMEEICQNVVFMKDGKITFEGTVEQAISKSSLKYEIRYLKNKEILILDVDESEKEERIQKLLDESCRIEKISLKVETLEKVFYKL